MWRRRRPICPWRILVTGYGAGRLQEAFAASLRRVCVTPGSCARRVQCGLHTRSQARTFACDLRRLAFCTRFFTCGKT